MAIQGNSPHFVPFPKKSEQRYADLHQRVPEWLREQKARALRGLIGRHFLASDAALAPLGLTAEEALLPLIERGLVLANDILPFHIRLSEFGEACLALGSMPRHSVAIVDQKALVRQLSP